MIKLTLVLVALLAACNITTEPMINLQCIAGDTVIITDSIITGCVDPRDIPVDSLFPDTIPADTVTT